MKKHFLASLLLAAASLNGMAADDTGVLTFMGLRDYTVYSISPNGEWAVGYFQNGVGNYYAFRWNLETNESELLSGNNDTSWAYDVANDGTVVGTYSDYTLSSNGAPVTAAGYYDDNVKSRRVMEKCGFRFHHTEEGKTSPLGDVRTEHFMRMMKEEWINNKRT